MRIDVLLLILIFILSSCNGPDKSSTANQEDEIIDINLSKALNNPKDFNLSEIVKEVEFITLESTVESYFRYAEKTQVTENFILIVGVRGLQEHRVFLFDRSGKFLRQIGRRGSGPGEFINIMNASIDPQERFIIAIDGQKYLKYKLDGRFVEEQQKPEGSRFGKFAQPLFLDNDHFIIANNRPILPTDNFFKISEFNSELSLARSMLPAPNNDSLCLRRMNLKLMAGDGEKWFFEGFVNNLYSIEVGHQPRLKYHFIIDQDAYTLDDMTGPFIGVDESRAYHSVESVTILPDYLIIRTEHNTKNKANIYQFLYDKEKKETSLLTNDFDSYNPLSEYDKFPYTFTNDLFGLPVLVGYFPDDSFSSITVDLDYFSNWINLKRFRELNVLMPEKRDVLADMVESYSGEELPLLILLHYK